MNSLTVQQHYNNINVHLFDQQDQNQFRCINSVTLPTTPERWGYMHVLQSKIPHLSPVQ